MPSPFSRQPLDNRLCYSYLITNPALWDAVRVMPGGKGRVRCLRVGPHQLRLRAARASCLPILGSAREVLTGLGQAKPGNTRADRVPGSMAWVAPWVT